MEINEEQSAKMPNFSTGSYGFHHTVDSALNTLSDLGISWSQITLRAAGPGWPLHWITTQSPRAGDVLGPDAVVTLSVAGLGLVDALPVGMRYTGDEREIETKEILDLVDDPLGKIAHWVREVSGLLVVRPDNHAACSLLIALFGLNSDDWPPEKWFRMALLLPCIHKLAGTEEGIRISLDLLLDLPLVEIRKSRRFSYMNRKDVSTLGSHSSRLGVDSIVGDRLEDSAGIELVIGPVTLARYYEIHQEENARHLEAVLDLCVACHQPHRVSWIVLDPEKAPRLGYPVANATLGVNSYLGAPQMTGTMHQRLAPPIFAGTPMIGEEDHGSR